VYHQVLVFQARIFAGVEQLKSCRYILGLRINKSGTESDSSGFAGKLWHNREASPVLIKASSLVGVLSNSEP